MNRINIRLLVPALAIALLGNAAHGDELRTIVLDPVGNLKARHLKRIGKSLGKTAIKLDHVDLTGWTPRTDNKRAAPAICATQPQCVADEGKDVRADVVIAVICNYVGRNADVTFSLVSVAGAAELTRSTVRVSKRGFAKDPGAKLTQFLNAQQTQEAMDLALAAANPEPAAAPTSPAAPESTPAPTESLEGPLPDDPTANAPAESPPTAPPPAPLHTTESASARGHSPELRKPLHVGVSTGVLFSQLQSELGTSFSVKLDGGYAVWRNLSAFGSLAYTQPTVASDLSDPRLAEADYMTDTTQRELTISMGAMWRLLTPGSRWNVYGGLAGRIWLLKTLTEGSSGSQSFLENDETSTRFGFGAIAGGEFGLGPGSVLGEIDVGGSDLPHTITGDVATTALSINVGYRVQL